MQFPICNHRPETSPRFMPVLCWRCTAIAAATMATICGNVSMYSDKVQGIGLSLALCFPCLLDGINSHFFNGTSNRLRLLTGGLAGLGIGNAILALY